jgi:hypothetical protein
MLASMKLFNNFNISHSIFPQRPLIGGFVLDNVYKELPMILKSIVQETAQCTFALWRSFSYFQWTDDLVKIEGIMRTKEK